MKSLILLISLIAPIYCTSKLGRCLCANDAICQDRVYEWGCIQIDHGEVLDHTNANSANPANDGIAAGSSLATFAGLALAGFPFSFLRINAASVTIRPFPLCSLSTTPD